MKIGIEVNPEILDAVEEQLIGLPVKYDGEVVGEITGVNRSDSTVQVRIEGNFTAGGVLLF